VSSRPRKWTFRLRHILEAVDRIQEYIAEMTYEEFAADQRTVEAVLHNFIIIGEATRHVPAPVTSRYPDVPWSQMRGMRNVAVDEYHRVSLGVIWKAGKEDLPPLVPMLQAVLEAEVDAE